jgi:hypothetical protein
MSSQWGVTVGVLVTLNFRTTSLLDADLLPIAQGRIKGFVGPRHFSSLDPFGDSKSIVLTTAYSRLSGLMGRGMHG